MRNLVNQSYWDVHYALLERFMAPEHDSVTRFLKEHIPNGKDKNAIEIGTYPGRYLVWLGTKGYTLHGIDMTPKVNELPQWLAMHGCKTGTFYCGDYMNHTFDIAYDVVLSIGFIEHFTEFDVVVRKHCELVRPGGMLCLLIPNFLGAIQQALHRLFDKENLKRHNLDAMNVKTLEGIVTEAGLRITYSGHFGGFEFWVDREQRGRIAEFCCNVALRAQKLFRWLPNHDAWSPYAAVVARRE